MQLTLVENLVVENKSLDGNVRQSNFAFQYVNKGLDLSSWFYYRCQADDDLLILTKFERPI